MIKATRSSWRAHFAGRFGVPVALLGLVSGLSPLTATVGAHAGTMQSYIVLYSASALPADASASIAKAGGSLVYSYPQIGVAIAKSDSASFRANLVKDNRVEGASSTAAFGTNAAAANGLGIVGVAPNVKIAGIKAGNADGYFFPQAVVCAFVWAGTHHVDVTNNSYFADPFLFNCRNDPVQHAIWKAEQRAIMYAQQNGVTVVAAEGNESEDLAHPSADATSPDFPPGSGVPRPVNNACV